VSYSGSACGIYGVGIALMPSLVEDGAGGGGKGQQKQSRKTWGWRKVYGYFFKVLIKGFGFISCFYFN
jgi:hypothetical protein